MSATFTLIGTVPSNAAGLQTALSELGFDLEVCVVVQPGVLAVELLAPENCSEEVVNQVQTCMDRWVASFDAPTSPPSASIRRARVPLLLAMGGPARWSIDAFEHICEALGLEYDSEYRIMLKPGSAAISVLVAKEVAADPEKAIQRAFAEWHELAGNKPVEAHVTVAALERPRLLQNVGSKEELLDTLKSMDPAPAPMAGASATNIVGASHSLLFRDAGPVSLIENATWTEVPASGLLLALVMLPEHAPFPYMTLVSAEDALRRGLNSDAATVRLDEAVAHPVPLVFKPVTNLVPTPRISAEPCISTPQPWRWKGQSADNVPTRPSAPTIFGWHLATCAFVAHLSADDTQVVCTVEPQLELKSWSPRGDWRPGEVIFIVCRAQGQLQCREYHVIQKESASRWILAGERPHAREGVILIQGSSAAADR